MTREQQRVNWLEEIFPNEIFTLETASADASFRSYYRVYIGQKSQILMDAPPDKEPCDSFIKISERLVKANIHAPKIYARNMQQGFLLLEDLGNRDYLGHLNENNVDEFYCEAIDTIIQMQQSAACDDLPKYDQDLLHREMALFKDYLMERHLGIRMSPSMLADWNHVNEILVHNALQQEQYFVHRDYHSRNLMVHERHNPGVIDYQDAVKGPITYDLVSLLKDCYIKWPLAKVESWVRYYYDNSTIAKAQGFEQCVRQFHLMGVQRHLKASGIFCRLYYRDGKDGYFKDIPRTLSYIVDLKDTFPELTTLCDLIEEEIQPQWQQVPTP